MQTIPKQRLFRIFSANEWNQPESTITSTQSTVHSGISASTFSSNAEKLRKNAISNDQTALTIKSQNSSEQRIKDPIPNYSNIL